MNALVIAAQLTTGESFGVAAFIVLAVVSAIRRRRRRAAMTPAERTAEDTRAELHGIRRALERRR